MIGRARRLRRDRTGAEKLLWHVLRHDQRGWRFRRQHPIPPYIVDFACVAARLVVEADGGQHGRAGDHIARENTLHQGGCPFWNNDILENREGVLQTIASTFGPHPAEKPPP
jgi:very-short-patch-repair endonuclease